MELDACEIIKLPIVCRYYKKPFDCSYYCDVESKESLKIYVKCDVSAMAQWLYLFELVREEGGHFTLKTFCESVTDADAVGIKKTEVFNFVIKRILAKTFADSSWVENHPEQKKEYRSDKRNLKKILKKLIEDYIR